MAKKAFLKDHDDIEILPITRGELVLDSSGNPAFSSNEFLATTSQPGLMSKEDKSKIDNLSSIGELTDEKVKQIATTTNASYRLLFSGTADDTTRIEYTGKSSKLLYNPSTGHLTSTKFVGDLAGTAASATRTKYIETMAYTGESWYGDKYKLYAKWFNGTVCDWKSTDDINNEYQVRVDIAKKLNTPRLLWGNEFDGTQSLSGTIVLTNNNHIRIKDTLGADCSVIGMTDGNNLMVGGDMISGSRTHNTYLYGYNIYFRTGANKTAMTITEEGNVNVAGGIKSGDKFILTTSSMNLGSATTPLYLFLARPDANYIWASANGGYINLGVYDAGATNSANATLSIYSDRVVSGQRNNAVSLGTSSFRWSNVYSVNGNFSGTITGNLDGTYVNKLTGYTKATAISALAATDTLNTALGKLEYKADVAYNLVKGAYDGDGTIENLEEILRVLDGIKDTETIKAIVGKYLPLTGGTVTGPITMNSRIKNYGLMEFHGDAGEYAFLSNNKFTGKGDGTNLAIYNGTSWFDILHTGNTGISNGTITINGTSITPITSHQDLSNYVTLNTNQTITGLKTFESDSTTTGVSLILKNKKWYSGMSTALDFYNGQLYSVPNARIETKMNGIGNQGGTLIFYTQQAHATENPNPNGLVERLRIDDNGNIKMRGNMEMYGSAHFNRYNATSNSAGASIVVNKSGDWFGMGPSSSNVSSFSFGLTSDHLGTWKKELMVISAGGNVGIGTSAPLEHLDVLGKIRSKGLIIHDHAGSNHWYYTRIATVYQNQSPNYLNGAMVFYTMYESHEAGSEVERMRIAANGAVGIGISNPGYPLHVNGLICSTTGFVKTGSSNDYVLLGAGSHKAISDFMLKSDELTTNLTTITKSLNVTADWMDTGIKSTDLAKGTYIIQVSVSGNDSTARMWDCIWSGIMSWDPQVTNDDEPDEIILHRAGHAYANTIYIRTLMTPRDTSGVGLKLQIAANKNIGAAYTYTFKFKRVI